MIALTRTVPPSINRCELTHLAREPIDVGRAERQHHAYEEALERAGCRVERLRPEPDLPDSVFVEDTAVVFDELAVMARPGAPSRRAEVASVAEAVAAHRPLARIEAPATLDGGDVLVIGRSVYVGIGRRTNLEALRQLEQHVAPHGYVVRRVETRDCLHLKSAVTRIASATVLLNAAWVDPAVFRQVERIEVDAGEPFAANALLVGDVVLASPAYPRTLARLHRLGLNVVAVDLGELAKAEGALTCCSLVL